MANLLAVLLVSSIKVSSVHEVNIQTDQGEENKVGKIRKGVPAEISALMYWWQLHTILLQIKHQQDCLKAN